jgi:hypothetical protein
MMSLFLSESTAVPKAVSETLPAGSGEDDLPIVIAAMPISVRERRIAFGVIIFLAIIDVLTVTFGNIQLSRVDALRGTSFLIAPLAKYPLLGRI